MNTENTNKQRAVAWLYPDLMERMDQLIVAKEMKNRTEFIAKAVDFYAGYLNTKDSTGYLADILLGAIQGTMKMTENRMANSLFRLSIELNMMMHLLATTLEIPDERLELLRGRSVKEVKKSNGRIHIEDAIAFQQQDIDPLKR